MCDAYKSNQKSPNNNYKLDELSSLGLGARDSMENKYEGYVWAKYSVLFVNTFFYEITCFAGSCLSCNNRVIQTACINSEKLKSR